MFSKSFQRILQVGRKILQNSCKNLTKNLQKPIKFTGSCKILREECIVNRVSFCKRFDSSTEKSDNQKRFDEFWELASTFQVFETSQLGPRKIQNIFTFRSSFILLVFLLTASKLFMVYFWWNNEILSPWILSGQKYLFQNHLKGARENLQIIFNRKLAYVCFRNFGRNKEK